MGLLIGIYALVGIFIAIESKILGEGGEDCSLDWVFKLLNLGGVVLTTIGIIRSLGLFTLGLGLFILAWILKEYIKKKYFNS